MLENNFVRGLSLDIYSVCIATFFTCSGFFSFAADKLFPQDKAAMSVGNASRGWGGHFVEESCWRGTGRARLEWKRGKGGEENM